MNISDDGLPYPDEFAHLRRHKPIHEVLDRETVTITKAEYERLKGDASALREIIEALHDVTGIVLTEWKIQSE